MNRGTISILCTAVAVVGTIATAIVAAYDTPKAMEILDEHRLDIDPSGETDLSWQEKAIDYAKGYWRTGIVATVTVTAEIVVCVLSTKSYKALVGMTATAAAIGGKYKDKAVELFGKEKARILDNAVKKDIRNDSFMTEKVWFQEPISGEFFQSTWKDVYEAEYEANKRIATEGWVALGEIFPEIEKRSPKTAEWIWCQDALLDDFGYPWLDFVHIRKNCIASEDGGVDWKFNEGRETYVIEYGIYPMPHDLLIENGYESPN